MDRRKEPRIEAGGRVTVTLLTGHPMSCAGQVVNFSGRGMRLVLEQPLPRNAPIRVDWNDSLLMGEVCYNAQQGDHYAVGVMLDQALLQASELMQLAEALGTAAAAATEPPTVHERTG
ncbi:MAG: PilZ domain-containing protein [Bryobacteraceae bacterium]|nr:PilZ domain-containing protein [Bryobacteraceae bacterium]